MYLKICMVILMASLASGRADVFIDEPALGGSLGGWKKKGGKAAEYSLSGADYRTYRPEITPTPDGGLFISIRIDHQRGWLSSDDHAMLEITVNKTGEVVSAQSSIAIQGRSITSDVIRASKNAKNAAVGVDRGIEIGTNLVADISEKLLREKIVEAGRVSYPSALRHNYNLLFQAIRVKKNTTVESDIPRANPIPPKTQEGQESKVQSVKAPTMKKYGSDDKPNFGLKN